MISRLAVRILIPTIVALSAAGSILTTAAVPASATAASASPAASAPGVFYHG